MGVIGEYGSAEVCLVGLGFDLCLLEWFNEQSRSMLKMILQNRNGFLLLLLLALASSHTPRDQFGFPKVSSQDALAKLLRSQRSFVISCFMSGHMDRGVMQEEGQSTSLGQTHTPEVQVARNYYYDLAAQFRRRWDGLTQDDKQKLLLGVVVVNNLSDFEQELLRGLAAKKAGQKGMSVGGYYDHLKGKLGSQWRRRVRLSFLGHTTSPGFIVCQMQLQVARRRKKEIVDRMGAIMQDSWRDWQRQKAEIVRQCEELQLFAELQGVPFQRSTTDCYRIYQVLTKLRIAVEGDAFYFRRVYRLFGSSNSQSAGSHSPPTAGLEDPFGPFPQPQQLPQTPQFDEHRLWQQQYFRHFKEIFFKYLQNSLRYFWSLHFSRTIHVCYAPKEKQILEVSLYRGLSSKDLFQKKTQFVERYNDWCQLIKLLRSLLQNALLKEEGLPGSNQQVQQIKAFVNLMTEGYKSFAPHILEYRQIQLTSNVEAIYRHAQAVRIIYRDARQTSAALYPFKYNPPQRSSSSSSSSSYHPSSQLGTEGQLHQLSNLLQGVEVQIATCQSKSTDVLRKSHTVFQKRAASLGGGSVSPGDGSKAKRRRLSGSPSEGQKDSHADKDLYQAVSDAELGILQMGITPEEEEQMREGTAMSLELTLEEYLSILRREEKQV